MSSHSYKRMELFFPNEILILISDEITDKKTWGRFAQANYFLSQNARKLVDKKKEEFGYHIISVNHFKPVLISFIDEMLDYFGAEEFRTLRLMIAHFDNTKLAEFILEIFGPYKLHINRGDDCFFDLLANPNNYQYRWFSLEFLNKYKYRWEQSDERDRKSILDWLSLLLRSAQNIVGSL